MTFLQSMLTFGLAALLAAPVSGAALVTKPEAQAMVNKAIVFLKAYGRDQTLLEVNQKEGKFSDRDLYLAVYGNDGTVRAHGANPKMIGKNLIDLKDVDGKAFVRERVELARTGKAFWQDYKFVNPMSGKTEPKTMYCQPYEDWIVCGGVYSK